MFNFLSSIRADFTNAQIAATEERIIKLEQYIAECKERARELDREQDHYEDQLIKAMEKRLDLIEMMEAAPTASTQTSQKLA